MGAWGVGILQDDTACQVYNEYIERYNQDEDHDIIRIELEQEFSETIANAQESTVFWLALARAQWECGVLQPDVLQHALDVVTGETDLERWRAANKAQVRKRQRLLLNFIETISQPRARPRRRRRIKAIPAVYQPGESLAIRLSDGDYGAGLVLAVDDSGTEGANLIGMLRYKGAEMPTREVFELRDWLLLTHHQWNGEICLFWCMAGDLRQESSRLHRVSRVLIRDDDPQVSNSVCGGNLSIQIELQYAWERNDHS